MPRGNSSPVYEVHAVFPSKTICVHMPPLMFTASVTVTKAREAKIWVDSSGGFLGCIFLDIHTNYRTHRIQSEFLRIPHLTRSWMYAVFLSRVLWNCGEYWSAGYKASPLKGSNVPWVSLPGSTGVTNPSKQKMGRQHVNPCMVVASRVAFCLHLLHFGGECSLLWLGGPLGTLSNDTNTPLDLYLVRFAGKIDTSVTSITR